jgi:hypothetical protein
MNAINIILQWLISAAFIISGAYLVFYTECGGESIPCMAAFIVAGLLATPLVGKIFEKVLPSLSKFAVRFMLAFLIAGIAGFAIFYSCQKSFSTTVPTVDTTMEHAPDSSMKKEPMQGGVLTDSEKKGEGDKLDLSDKGRRVSVRDEKEQSTGDSYDSKTAQDRPIQAQPVRKKETVARKKASRDEDAPAEYTDKSVKPEKRRSDTVAKKPVTIDDKSSASIAKKTKKKEDKAIASDKKRAEDKAITSDKKKSEDKAIVSDKKKSEDKYCVKIEK